MVWTAISSITMVGFAALAIDVGYMFAVRAELQRTADSAALAAASQLVNGDTPAQRRAHALETAQLYAAQNESDRRAVEVTPGDVAFGTYTHNLATGKYTFVPDDSTSPSAVRVTARRADVGLLFSKVFGFTTTDISARATAVLTPRDVAVVIDLSASMKYDSNLRFYRETQINDRDIWCSLDGPAPARPYTPGAENETQYAGDTGPTIGVMDTWGSAMSTSYNPTTDPGLWHLPMNQTCTISAVLTKLQNRGYSSTNRTRITAATSNESEWRNRTAVMIGLADWTPANSSDTTVNELTWKPYPSYRKTWSWADYIDWVADSNSDLTNVHSQFRYRYGLKTYVDFLLDGPENFSQTDLTMTPQEPITAVKDAVQILVNMAGSSDKMSLEIFGTTSRHEVNLTHDRQQVADTLYARQAHHYDNNTNIGGGLQEAIGELTSARARQGVHKVIVLMSDGASTTGPDASSVAETAAEQGMKIYTVSVGYSADRELMQQIAAIGHGEEFYAAGSPEDYTDDLRRIFQQIGGRREVVLID